MPVAYFRINKKYRLIAGFLLLFSFTAPVLAADPLQPMVRIKDLATIEGVRSNQLVGMGLVVGLQGTGDRGGTAMQMMSNMTKQFGILMDPRQIRSRNIAVVSVTATLPPFALPGQNADVLVSTLGDAKSLQGGVLLQTALKGANGQTYAVAQGPLTLGGFDGGSAGGSSVRRNITTVARIPDGGIVEQGVPMNFSQGGQMNLLLRRPDFTTAQRIASALNAKFGNVASPVDGGRVEVTLPESLRNSPSSFIASMEGLTIRPDTVARVVINERTGTVVMGGRVTIGAAAVSHGSLTVRIDKMTGVSQPGILSGGTTKKVTNDTVGIEEGTGQILTLPTSSTVEDLAAALNVVGASPRDLIPILQALNEAGALHGELIIQ